MCNKLIILFISLSCLVILCSSQNHTMGALSPLDPSSYSRPELAIIKHISLALDVDFERKVLNGEATLNFDVLANVKDLILDVSNLKIGSIHLINGSQLEYKLSEHIPNFGSKLTILLPTEASKGEKKVDGGKANSSCRCSCQSRGENKHSAKTPIDTASVSTDGVSALSAEEQNDSSRCNSSVGDSVIYYKIDTSVCDKDCGKSELPNGPVSEMPPLYQASCCNVTDCSFPKYGISITIKYSTDPSASALQWLSAAQTSGKKHPYMFSQCQPIHARSILPCQDTPAVKFTYDAVVSAPEEFTVLMSALRGEVRSNKTSFRQPMPLPSYLVAIAAGVLESRPLGPRSNVWSEKEEIERSAWEFAETEKYLQAAERLCGAYEWAQYDLLVLPPSFPYGGMENPCLTFVTPTLLAGDRSQASVIVHEIMHSWTGNLVTNRNFEHFWLNEGFTVFLERKVAASLINNTVEAKQDRDFQSLLGLQELTEAIKEFGESNPLTNLVVNLEGVHPDDAFSRVPYEKGSLFLRYLENLAGGPEVFDDFLRSYLKEFSKKSLDTNQFKSYLLEYFKDNDNLKKLDWDLWLNTPGMPPVIPDYDTTMTKAVTVLINKLDSKNVTFLSEDVSAFTPHQIINYLQELIERPPLTIEQLREMGTNYNVDGNKNTEILFRWLRLCVKSKDDSKLDDVFAFLNSNGRMKYVRPLYRDLYGWEEVRDRAVQNFLENEPNMMHVSAYTLRKDLHLSN